MRKENLNHMRKNNWACFLLVLAGIVIGGFIGNLFPSTWLNYGQSFGLDLGILSVTFGLSIKITIASILGIAAAIMIYRFI